MTRKIDEVLQAAVAEGDVPGVVALAAGDDGVLYEGAAGRRAADAGDPITPDTMLRIASMTKMVTTTAALQLSGRGRLELDAPVETYRPEFADLQVLEGFDGDAPRLRPPGTRATVRQLITHTAGLGYWFWNSEIDRHEQVTGTPNMLSGSDAMFTSPLLFDPGTRFEYGINIDWLGRVVEAVSGQSLDAYFLANITGPLGMTSTTAKMTDAQRASSAPIHVRGEDGSWAVTDIDWAQDPDCSGGGHFLYATPRDYLAFQRMLLGGGALGDVRSWRKPPLTRRSPTRSASSTSRPRSPPRTLSSAPTSASAPTSNGAWDCCSTRRNSLACERPAAARGPACPTLTSGSTPQTG